MTDTNTDTTDDSTDTTADPIEPGHDLRSGPDPEPDARPAPDGEQRQRDENGGVIDRLKGSGKSGGDAERPPREVVHTLEVDMENGDVALYDLQRHRNGDETAVLLCAFGNGYQALAFDVDAGGQLLEVEEIGDATDEATAVGMLEYWGKQNPDGILGGAPEQESFLEKLGFGGGGA